MGGATVDRQVWIARTGDAAPAEGRLEPEAAARVAATGTTVRRGLGLLETFRIVSGSVPLLDQHRERLARSAHALGLPLPDLDAGAIVSELCRANRLPHAVGRIVLGSDFVLVQCEPLPATLAAERRDGIELPLLRFDWGPAEHKVTSRAALELAEQRAGGEVARLGGEGRLLESTRSNLFVVSEQGLESAAPPAVLPGVARGVVLELARAQGLAVRRRAPRRTDASGWREAFVTNAVRGVRPVRRLGSDELGDPGPITRSLQRALDERLGL